MKLIMSLIAVVFSMNVFAANPQDCFKIKNGLDRKYCMDKYLETIKDKLKAEKTTWKNGLTAKDKATKAKAFNEDIQARKDYMALMQSEIEIHEKLVAELDATKVAAPAAPKKEKKKKNLFGIKL